MCGSMVDIQSSTTEIMQGRKRRKKIEITGQKYNAPLLHRVAITRMWANAQRDGRPAEHRWCPVFNAAKFGWRSLLDCSNTAKSRKPLKLAGAPHIGKPISALLVGRSSLYCGDIWRTNCCLTSFFFLIVDTCLSREDIAWQSCHMVPRWRILAIFFVFCVFSELRAAHFWPAS